MPKSSGKSKLLSLETSYQKLKYRLSTSRSTRIKLERLRLFLDSLARSDDNHEYYSYFDELIQNYIELITYNNLECRSIEVLCSLKLIEETFIGLNIKDSTSSEFLNTQNILLNQIVLTYIYIGQWYQGLRVLSPTIKKSDFIKVHTNLKNSLINSSESTTLNKLVDSLGDNTLKKNKNLKTILSTLEHWEEQLTKPEIGKIWVLLVEYEAQDVFGNDKKNEDIVALGNIQQLNANSINLPSASAEDFVLFNNLSISYNDLLYQQANTAIKVAKHHLGKSVTKVNNKFNVIYSFNKKEPYYSGESLGLAMTLSAISSLSKENDYQYKYSLLQDYSTTGSIAHDGAINSIMDKALTTKLQTIFYSPFKKILIPKRNQALALKELKKLKEHYPNRKLDVLAITNVKDAATSSYLALRQKTSFPDRIRHYWDYWKIATIVLLAGLIIANLISQLTSDKNPVELKVAGSRIEVYNINDKKLWDYDFGIELETRFYDKPQLHLPTQRQLYNFKDLTGDGSNELIFATRSNNLNNTELYYFNSDGKVAWLFNTNPEMEFGNKRIDNVYNIISVCTNEFNGKKLIFALLHHHVLYPARFLAFDIEGNIVGEYWNSGHINSVVFSDINNDEIDEILLGGCNNDYNTGIISVLDYNQIRGHSPQLQDKYTPKNIPLGNHLYYLKFPTPDQLFFGRRGTVINNFHLSNNTFRLSLSTGENFSFLVYYIFNNDFKIIDFSLTDTYILDYKEKFNRNVYDVYSIEELYEKFSKIEYWDGEKFVNYPVRNNKNIE